jgi:CRP-like cAMP-binding protein
VSEDIEVDAGTVLCREGELGSEFFVIVEGKVKITKNGRRIAQRGGGEFIGEIALLEDVPRTATVTAETPLRMFVLTSVHFKHLVAESPKVESKVLRALARRLAELSSDPQLA